MVGFMGAIQFYGNALGQSKYISDRKLGEISAFSMITFQL